jgi:hypothetical protein
MVFFMEALDLLLYVTQQFGIMLGVGAETILLFLYLFAMRDGAIGKEEGRFLRINRRAIYVSFCCIIVSGAVVTLLHVLAGQWASIVSSPGYMFKWALILFALLCTLADTKGATVFMKGVGAGVWYALFAVHILAPITTWGVLLAVFSAWLLAFMLVWTAFSWVVIKKPKTTPAAAPIPAPPAVAVVSSPAPVMPPPQEKKNVFALPVSDEKFPYTKPSPEETPLLHPHLTGEKINPLLPQPPTAPQTGAASQNTEDTTLHAIRVMPQTPEDLQTQSRGPLVQFG